MSVLKGRLPRGCWQSSSLNSQSAGLSCSLPLNSSWSAALKHWKRTLEVPPLPNQQDFGHSGQPCTCAGKANIKEHQVGKILYSVLIQMSVLPSSSYAQLLAVYGVLRCPLQHLRVCVLESAEYVCGSKMGTQNRNPGKWRHELKPAVPGSLLAHTHMAFRRCLNHLPRQLAGTAQSPGEWAAASELPCPR